jgi:hypothetical protein
VCTDQAPKPWRFSHTVTSRLHIGNLYIVDSEKLAAIAVNGARIALMTIRSGGQTGVDRAALQVAVALGIPYGGWCPRGGWAEDSPTPPGVRAHFPILVETPSPDPRQRTAWNVRDSDATMLIVDSDPSDSRGTEFTHACAELMLQRPIVRGHF